MGSHILTIDVEEYYHAENIQDSVPEDVIKTLPSRVSIGVRKILDLLERHDSKATFFVLGCVAEKNKDLIREISNAGHEVASHGCSHTPLYRHSAATFEEDLANSLKILSDITGQGIIGYRSTSFSSPKDLPWFFDILRKYKIIYDSSMALSLFRPSSSRLGYFEISKDILEFPVSFLKIGPLKIPLGGGYFRAYPYLLTKLGLDRAAQDEKSISIFYLHPWELDPGQPRFRLPPVKQIRHYLNLENAEKKLERLLSDIKFDSIKNFLNR